MNASFIKRSSALVSKDPNWIKPTCSDPDVGKEEEAKQALALKSLRKMTDQILTLELFERVDTVHSQSDLFNASNDGADIRSLIKSELKPVRQINEDIILLQIVLAKILNSMSNIRAANASLSHVVNINKSV